jgi:hypothetical protein
LVRRTILLLPTCFYCNKPCKTMLDPLYPKPWRWVQLPSEDSTPVFKERAALLLPKHERVLQGQAWSINRWPSAQSTVGCNRKVGARVLQSPRLECTKALGSSGTEAGPGRVDLSLAGSSSSRPECERAPLTIDTALFAVPSVMSTHRLCHVPSHEVPGAHLIIVHLFVSKDLVADPSSVTIASPAFFRRSLVSSAAGPANY